MLIENTGTLRPWSSSLFLVNLQVKFMNFVNFFRVAFSGNTFERVVLSFIEFNGEFGWCTFECILNVFCLYCSHVCVLKAPFRCFIVDTESLDIFLNSFCWYIQINPVQIPQRSYFYSIMTCRKLTVGTLNLFKVRNKNIGTTSMNVERIE